MNSFRTMEPVEIISRTPDRIECSVIEPDGEDNLVQTSTKPSWIARVYEENGQTFADVGSLLFLKAGEHNPFHSAAVHNIAADILTFFNEDEDPVESDFAAKTICDVLRESSRTNLVPKYLADFYGPEDIGIDASKLRIESDRWNMPFSEKTMNELDIQKSEHAFVIYQGLCYDTGCPEGQPNGPFELQEILKEVGNVIRARGEHFETTLKAQNPGYVKKALDASAHIKNEVQPKNNSPSL